MRVSAQPQNRSLDLVIAVILRRRSNVTMSLSNVIVQC